MLLYGASRPFLWVPLRAPPSASTPHFSPFPSALSAQSEILSFVAASQMITVLSYDPDATWEPFRAPANQEEFHSGKLEGAFRLAN